MVLRIFFSVSVLLCALILAAVLVGCAPYQPAVLDDWQSPNHVNLQQDYHDCEIQARNAAHNNSGEAVKGGAVGAVAGGAVGAGAGAMAGSPELGAAAGALAGVAAGAFSTLYNNDTRFHALYDDCMRYRGHKVLP